MKASNLPLDDLESPVALLRRVLLLLGRVVRQHVQLLLFGHGAAVVRTRQGQELGGSRWVELFPVLLFYAHFPREIIWLKLKVGAISCLYI